MQKRRAVRDAKWALEDVFNKLNGVMYGSSVLRVFPYNWEINISNRDRPGGHKSQDMGGWYGYVKSKSNKRMANKQLRKQQRKAALEALADYEWCNEPDEFSHMFNEIQAYDDWMDLYDDCMELDDRSEMDWDDQLYDDILADYYGDYDLGYRL